MIAATRDLDGAVLAARERESAWWIVVEGWHPSDLVQTQDPRDGSWHLMSADDGRVLSTVRVEWSEQCARVVVCRPGADAS